MNKNYGSYASNSQLKLPLPSYIDEKLKLAIWLKILIGTLSCCNYVIYKSLLNDTNWEKYKFGAINVYKESMVLLKFYLCFSLHH